MGLFNNNGKNNNVAVAEVDVYYSVEDGELPAPEEVPAPATSSRSKAIKASDELVDVRNRVKRLERLLLAVAGILGIVVLYVAWKIDVHGLPSKARDGRWHTAMLASIPIVAMLFTWFHIWLAIEMMFLPTKFVGCCQWGPGIGLGWQGVVPRKATKMAKTAYRSAKPFLMQMDEVLGRIDGEELLIVVDSDLKRVIKRSLNRVGNERFPAIYQKLPEVARDELALAVLEAIQSAVPATLKAARPLLADLDYEDMIVTVFQQKKELLNTFFRKIGSKEFIFIERCGAMLGLLCGTIQLICFQYLSPMGQIIFLPLTGFVLGNFSNWAALKACFWPVDPVKVTIFGKHLFTSQGLFLSRQAEVCTLYSDLLVQHFFNLHRIVAYLRTQKKVWAQLMELRRKTMRETVNDNIGSGLKSIARGLDPFVEGVVDVILEESSRDADLNSHTEHYMITASDIEETNSRRMMQMTPTQFEDLLHPVFQEDEWILIVLGGVLGAVVGAGQVLILGH
jgi:uncharacterized membrane protein YheB (UPF0754 family)